MSAPFHLASSTREMLCWLDIFHPERLPHVMAHRSEAEKEAAREFLRESRRERAAEKSDVPQKPGQPVQAAPALSAPAHQKQRPA
jgi:hypothetical protein